MTQSVYNSIKDIYMDKKKAINDYINELCDDDMIDYEYLNDYESEEEIVKLIQSSIELD